LLQHRDAACWTGQVNHANALATQRHTLLLLLLLLLGDGGASSLVLR